MVTSTITEHLEKLRYFVAIAEEGTMVQAAQKFRISQPSLSHSIKVLEEVIGVKLFDRATTGVTLTRSGEKLYTFAKNVLENARQVEHALRLADEGEVGRVTIGTKEPYAIYQWPKYFEFLQAAFPNLEISLSVDRYNQNLVTALRDEKLDMVMIPDPPELEGVMAYELFKDRYHLYVSNERYEKSSLEQLLQLPIYLFQGAMAAGNKQLGTALKNDAELVKRARDVDSFNVARSFAINGLGIGLLSERMASEDVKAGRLREIELPKMKLPTLGALKVCLCVLEKNLGNKHLQTIRKALRQYHLAN